MDSHWKHCLADYLRSLRSPATRTSYATILIRFFSQHDPEHVTKRTVEHFMHEHFPDPHRTTQGELAAATQNQRVAAIGAFYTYASSYIPEGKTEPLWQRPIPTLGIVRGKPERSPKGLTLDELSRLFSIIPTASEVGIRDKALLLFYLYSARRRSEIAELRYEDIQPATFPDGEGGMREGWVYFFRGKGKKSVRDSAELVPIVKQAIDWYLISSGRIDTIQPKDPLFTSTMHGRQEPLSDSTIAKRIAYYARQAGIRASLHTLRHTAAQMRAASGENIVSIQNLLRHSSLQTTYLYLLGLTGTEDPGYTRLLEKFEHLSQ